MPSHDPIMIYIIPPSTAPSSPLLLCSLACSAEPLARASACGPFSPLSTLPVRPSRLHGVRLPSLVCRPPFPRCRPDASHSFSQSVWGLFRHARPISRSLTEKQQSVTTSMCRGQVRVATCPLSSLHVEIIPTRGYPTFQADLCSGEYRRSSLAFLLVEPLSGISS